MQPHIMIVDDDRSITKVVNFLLGDAGYQTMVLNDPRGIHALLQEGSFDLVLLEVVLPYIDGLTLCNALRREHPETAIVFLSTLSTPKDKANGLNAGADDYIGKPFESAELLLRIHSVLRRYQRTVPEAGGVVIAVGDARLDIGRAQFATASRRPVLMTPTELRILECLMRHANTVVPRQALVACIGRHRSVLASNRIDVCVRRIRSKIECDPEHPALLHTVRGVGYLYRHCAVTKSSATR
jgi:two-component system response regulator RegX3